MHRQDLAFGGREGVIAMTGSESSESEFYTEEDFIGRDIL